MIINADSTQLPLPDNSVDIIVTSPPYNLQKAYGSDDSLDINGYIHFAWTIGNECFRVLKNTGRLCLNIPIDTNLGGKKFLSAIWHNELWGDFNYQTSIVWNKDQINSRTAWGSWMSPSAPNVVAPCELVLVYSKGNWKRNYKGTPMISRDEFLAWTLGRWDIRPESAKRVKHPAPFPEQLVERLLKMFAWKEDIVLEPFSGSGTTGKVAETLGMQHIEVDLSFDFCKLSQERIYG